MGLPGLPGLPREARIAQDYQDCPGRQGGRNNGPSNLSLARVSPFGARGKIGARAWLGKETIVWFDLVKRLL